MAKKQRSALKAGVFIVVSVAAVIGLVVGIKGLDHFTDPVQTRTVRFSLTDDIGGLRVGDEVRAGGFKIGEVKNIVVTGASDDDALAGPDQRVGAVAILITYAIPKKYAVRQNAKLGIQGTLTGVSWLNFESFGTGAKLDESVALVGRPSPMGQLMATLSDVAPTIKETLADTRTAIAEAKGAIVDVRQKTLPAVNEAIAKASKTADSFTNTGETATKFIKDIHDKQAPKVVDAYLDVMKKAGDMMQKAAAFFGDTTPDFRATLANLNKATSNVSEKLPGILEGVDGMVQKINGTLASAQSALGDVKEATSNAKEMTASVKSVLVGNQGKLDGMIASLKTAGDNLKHATAEIRHSPWRLLYKPTGGELENLNLFDAAREFAEGAGSVDDASTALRDALRNKDVQPAEVKRLVEQLEKSMTNFHDVEQKLWTKVKE